MIFKGISKEFSLQNEDQYNTIGDFWDEMALLYGLENLQGLGYKWANGKIFYAIGLKIGDIQGCNFSIELPDEPWTVVHGKTENLKEIYDEIYQFGPLKYEIETFDENGRCQIKYHR
jgi:predicted transcriptional regulator YdeE